MLHDCSDEFDLDEIFRKLTEQSPAKQTTVCANAFFERRDELSLLQEKFDAMDFSDAPSLDFLDSDD